MRMLVKDTRSQDGKDDKDNDKGSKSRSQSMKEQAYNKEQRERPRPHELNDESNLIDLMKESGTLTGEAISCGTLSKSNEKRKAVEEDAKSGRLNRAPGQAGNPLALEGNHNNEIIEIKSGEELYNYFISTEFVSLLNVKPSIANPSYVIEIADGRKVEVNRIICGCKLELGNSLFTIDLISLGHRSFDVIIGMDWLSQNKAVIVCHEKVVEISLIVGEILRVQGECALGVGKTLMNVKVDEPKMGDIFVVWDFVDVFLEDLSGLPP
ncbi:putative reverse transcriptase domain-containing protein [Tanacetum coccineum]